MSKSLEYHIHHKDGDVTNNSLDNLMVVHASYCHSHLQALLRMKTPKGYERSGIWLLAHVSKEIRERLLIRSVGLCEFCKKPLKAKSRKLTHYEFFRRNDKIACVLLRLLENKPILASELIEALPYLRSRLGDITYRSHGAKREIEKLNQDGKLIYKKSLPFLGFTSDFLSQLNKNFLKLITSREETEDKSISSVEPPDWF